MMLRIFAGSMLVVLVGAAGRGPFPAGTINGKVTYTGTPPKAHPIDMAKEPNCVTQHPTPVSTQDAVTGPGNSVRYVVGCALGGVPVYVTLPLIVPAGNG